MTATAIMAALEYDVKILMTQTHYTMNNLEAPLLGLVDIKEKSDVLADIGLGALFKEIMVAPLDYEAVRNCSVNLIRNKLSLLPGNFVNNIDIFRKDMDDMIGQALYGCNQFYDYVFVDTPSGINPLSQKILSQSDVIIVNLCQNLTLLDNFFHDFDLSQYPAKHIFYVIGDYDPNSKYNYFYLLNNYPLKKSNSAVVPYNTNFRDSIIDSSPIQFFQTWNVHAMERSHKDYYFFTQIYNLVVKLFRMVDERRVRER